MNIFHKVTLQTMKQARTRTMVTIIGVILSAAMFCAVTTFAASLRQFLIDQCIYNSGDYFGAVAELSPEQVQKLAADDRVSQVGSMEFQGFSDLGDKAFYEPYLSVAAVNDTFLRSMPIDLIDGRLPENSHELVISKNYQDISGAAGQPLQIGSTVTLSLGWRHSLDGAPMSQTEVFYTDGQGSRLEALTDFEARAYTIVGIAEHDLYFSNWDLPADRALTCLDENARAGVTSVYFKTKDPADAAPLVEEYGAMQENGGGYWANQSLLDLYGQTRYSSFNLMIGGIVSILAVIIMVGAISLIHNAFSISLSERSKQFGLLSSVGATKKQLRKMIFAEAWTVSLIGIPIGVLAGVGGIGITLYWIRNNLDHVFFGEKAILRLHFSWAAVLAAAFISLVTVLISAWIPARRAAKITAIEAIRQSRDIHVAPKAVKVSNCSRKIFGLEGLLAQKYFQCSKKKYRATVVSLALSVILFISASSFSMYMTSMFTDNFSVRDYDAELYLYGDDFDLYSQIAALPTVERSSYYIERTSSEGLTDLENITPEYQKFLENWDAAAIQNGKVWLSAPKTVYLDDDTFRQYLHMQGIDPAPYFDKEGPLPLVLNHGSMTIYSEDENGNYNRVTYTCDRLKPGVSTILLGTLPQPEALDPNAGYTNSYFVTDFKENGTLVLQEFGQTEQYGEWTSTILGEYPLDMQEIPLGQKITEPPFGLNSGEYRLVLIYPISAAPADLEPNYSLVLKGTAPAAMSQDVLKILEGHNLSNNYVDYAAQEDGERQLLTIVKIFSYGFIVLISLISVANVFNTISTNISLRRRDFAMLRSVGLTNKGLNRMMNYECLLYGTKALLWGLPLTLPVCYFLWKTLSLSVSAPFMLPWGAVAVAVCTVFLVVFITMLYAMSKIKKQSTVDALKDENL